MSLDSYYANMSPCKTKKFLTFHHNNPQVFKLFSRFGKEALNAGVKTLSSSLIFERMRWEAYIVTRTTDGYKISNDYKPYYARLFEMMNPELKGSFNNKQSEANEIFEDGIRDSLIDATKRLT